MGMESAGRGFIEGCSNMLSEGGVGMKWLDGKVGLLIAFLLGVMAARLGPTAVQGILWIIKDGDSMSESSSDAGDNKSDQRRERERKRKLRMRVSAVGTAGSGSLRSSSGDPCSDYSSQDPMSSSAANLLHQQQQQQQSQVSLDDQRRACEAYRRSLANGEGVSTKTLIHASGAQLIEWGNEAREILMDVVIGRANMVSGASRNGVDYGQQSWDLTHSAENFHLWRSRGVRGMDGNGFLLRSSAFVEHSARDVLLWLLRENLTLGLEGIVTSQSVLTPSDSAIIESKYNSDNSADESPGTGSMGDAAMIARRVMVAPFSITTSKRDFVVVTRWGELDSHSYYIASRSVPNSAFPKSKNYVRGTVHCTGFILRNVRRDEGEGVERVGCEIMHAVHMSVAAKKVPDGGKRRSRFEQSRVHELQRYMINLVVHRIQSRKEVLVLQRDQKQMQKQKQKQKGNDRRTNKWDPDWASVLAPPQNLGSQPQTPVEILPESNGVSSEQMLNINSAAISARAILRSLHEPARDKWEQFHDSDGIRISELVLGADDGGDKSTRMGTLMATCLVKAPPSRVRQLLVDQPASLDGLLENRAVLARVTPQTSVQWLAYGAIWPVGSRDFLVVTSEEIVKGGADGHGDGFMLVSKSIDDICEDVELGDDGEESGPDSGRDDSMKYATPPGLANGAAMGMGHGSYNFGSDSSLTSGGTGGGGFGRRISKDSTSNLSDTDDVVATSSSPPDSAAGAAGGPLSTPRRLRLDSQLSDHLAGLIAEAGEDETSTRRSHAQGEQLASDPGSQYTRSNLRLAGYVGVPSRDEPGSTEIFLYVDVDVYDFVPAWLLKVLAQYGLAEIMSRIRSICAEQVSVPRGVALLPTASRVGEVAGYPNRADSPSTSPPVAASSSSSSRFPTSEETARGNSDAAAAGGSDGGCGYGDEAVQEFHSYLGLAHPKMPSRNLEWVVKLSRRGVEVSQAPIEGCNYTALKATMRMKAMAGHIAELLTDDNRMREYDDMIDSISFLRNKPEGAPDGPDHGRTRRMCMKGIWPTAAREFVACTTRRDLTDGSILMCSRTPPDQLECCPVNKGYVRGIIYVSGYLLVPVAPGPNGEHTEVDVTLVSHVDLGGNIPSSMLNMLSSSAPVKILTTIQNVVRNRDDFQ